MEILIILGVIWLIAYIFSGGKKTGNTNSGNYLDKYRPGGPCPTCGGYGKVGGIYECPACRGTGRQ